jgi:hypothetical protein
VQRLFAPACQTGKHCKMKKYFYPVMLFACPVAIVLLFTGCLKDDCRHAYKIFTPVYKTLSELRSSVQGGAAIPLVNTGKLYIKANWIYLNEKDKGIHVIDNSNPSQPKNNAFITIPGNIDIAMKGDILYADLYSDFATIDISNPKNISVKKYLTNTFPSRVNYTNSTNPDSINAVVAWTSKDTVVDCETINQWNNCINCGIYYAASSQAVSPGAGTTGSMARFASLNNYMYAVSNSDLNVIDITDAANPLFVKRQNIGWNIETIFPHDNKLFIGAGSSMSIYDVQDPVNPQQLSWSGHWCSHDPVIADDRYAYVTLHDADACNSKVNQLEIYSLQYNTSPVLLKTYPLVNPQGLSKDGDLLFICDGKDGLKIFDTKDVHDIKLIKYLPGPHAYDVIAVNGIAYVSAKEGLYQYDYSNTGNIHLLSKLSKN